MIHLYKSHSRKSKQHSIGHQREMSEFRFKVRKGLLYTILADGTQDVAKNISLQFCRDIWESKMKSRKIFFKSFVSEDTTGIHCLLVTVLHYSMLKTFSVRFRDTRCS